MVIGYTLAIVFAVIWLGFKLLEAIKAKNAKKAAEKVVETVKTYENDVDDLIL